MRLCRLSPSGIEYLDYAWNFYSGCENPERGICPLGRDCWARKITERFKNHYPNGFEPTFYPEAFLSPLHLKKPSIIGVAFMGDLFGDWVDPDKKFHSVMPSGKASVSISLKGWIFTTIKQCPQHTFLFLTKCPWNLPKWGKFPDNCYVGVTATGQQQYWFAMTGLAKINCKVRYISFEPLLEEIVVGDGIKYIDWLIIGTQTKPIVLPKLEWVREIVEAADKAGLPVFIKDNLGWPRLTADGSTPFYKRGSSGTWELRQEMPD